MDERAKISIRWQKALLLRKSRAFLVKFLLLAKVAKKLKKELAEPL